MEEIPGSFGEENPEAGLKVIVSRLGERPPPKPISSIRGAFGLLSDGEYAYLYRESLRIAGGILNQRAFPDDRIHDVAVDGMFAFIVVISSGASAGMNAKTLLATIVRNKAIDVARVKKNRRLKPASEEQLSRLADRHYIEPSKNAEFNETITMLRSAISKLPASHAEIMDLRYCQMLEPIEIASRLCISYRAVITRINRARRALKGILESGKE